MTLPPCIGTHKDGATLRLRVQPRASRSGPQGLHGESLKWGIHAAPVDGKANEELVASLAEFLDIPKRSISIVKGTTSREKTVLLEGVDPQQVRTLLASAF